MTDAETRAAAQCVAVDGHHARDARRRGSAGKACRTTARLTRFLRCGWTRCVAAGAAQVPFTSGILIGIGETRLERIESLLALRAIHAEHGHVQEIIVQNFRAKPGTKMARAPEPDLDELLWTIAVARIVFGPSMSIQAPPNLSPGVLPQIVAAGINDWGGVSPLTPDFVNPEAPWPHLDELAPRNRARRQAPDRAADDLSEVRAARPDVGSPSRCAQRVLELVDASGLPRTDTWSPGETESPPADVLRCDRRRRCAGVTAGRGDTRARDPRRRSVRSRRRDGCSRRAAAISPPSFMRPMRFAAASMATW